MYLCREGNKRLNMYDMKLIFGAAAAVNADKVVQVV
jgi:hypothetical protein